MGTEVGRAQKEMTPDAGGDASFPKYNALGKILDMLPRKTAAVVGDICLDKYLLINPKLRDTSKETGLPVNQVTKVRVHPGGGGNVAANLKALGFGEVLPVGFHGSDGEGWELAQSFTDAGISLKFFTPARELRTPTFLKPLLLEDGGPRELQRFDLFSRMDLPRDIEDELAARIEKAAECADVLLVADYHEVGKTPTLTPRLRRLLNGIARRRPELPVLVDSRLHSADYSAASLKPNLEEAAALFGLGISPAVEEIEMAAAELARKTKRPIYVTLAEEGILARGPGGESACASALPARGPIDIVGAGDTVAAALAAGMTAGASLENTGRLAMLAASITVHKVGKTGTAAPAEILELNKTLIERKASQ